VHLRAVNSFADSWKSCCIWLMLSAFFNTCKLQPNVILVTCTSRYYQMINGNLRHDFRYGFAAT
jgi:hypothetical protein